MEMPLTTTLCFQIQNSSLSQFACELHGFVLFCFVCVCVFNKTARTNACNQHYLAGTNILISILWERGGEQRRVEKAGLKNIFLAYSSLNHFILAEKATHIVVIVTINDKYLIK
jgi:hypothetical protein